jgi:hypothetical protein
VRRPPAPTAKYREPLLVAGAVGAASCTRSGAERRDSNDEPARTWGRGQHEPRSPTPTVIRQPAIGPC